MDTNRPHCKITVFGPLNDRWADYLGDMNRAVSIADGEILTTTLTGQPADLLAFIGMLSAIANFGFTVIDMEYHQKERIL